MHDYPQMIAPVNHVEPAPRRVTRDAGRRGCVGHDRALYVWEWPNYPQYYIPLADVGGGFLVDEDHPQRVPQARRGATGLAWVRYLAPRPHGSFGRSRSTGWPERFASTGTHSMPGSRRTRRSSSIPRNPYTRVDALRSTRHVRWSSRAWCWPSPTATVMVFETGLPTRYYFDRSDVNFEHLVATETVTSCPYKGHDQRLLVGRVGDEVHTDLAWTYEFPTRQLLPIAGLVSFYNEKVDVVIDGEMLIRPSTPFS